MYAFFISKNGVMLLIFGFVDAIIILYNMRKGSFMKKLFAFLLSLFILFNTTILKPQAVISPPPTLSAESAVLIDLDSKAILFEHGSDRRLGMASTTKIMTALIAAERSDINQRVKIPDEAIGVEGSSIYLQNGETLTPIASSGIFTR